VVRFKLQPAAGLEDVIADGFQGRSQNGQRAKSFHTGVLLVIEEPEAHLHPLAQRWLAGRIAQMCDDGLQVVLTTHNAAFIDVLNIEGLVLVTKDEDGTDVTQIDRERLVEHCIETGAPSEKIDVDNVLPFSAANASREILEGFFAKVVVLVEGPTEAMSLPIYLERVGLDTAKEGGRCHNEGGPTLWGILWGPLRRNGTNSYQPQIVENPRNPLNLLHEHDVM
jgi:putative ATP-dependent endonuclease of OLD family